MVCTWYYLDFEWVEKVELVRSFELILTIYSNKENYIVNLTSSQDIQVRWEDIVSMGQKIINGKYPINDILWWGKAQNFFQFQKRFWQTILRYPGGGMTKYHLLHKFRMVLFHLLPALIIDSILFCLGFKPM